MPEFHAYPAGRGRALEQSERRRRSRAQEVPLPVSWVVDKGQLKEPGAWILRFCRHGQGSSAHKLTKTAGDKERALALTPLRKSRQRNAHGTAGTSAALGLRGCVHECGYSLTSVPLSDQPDRKEGL
ncbi:hypothetical protein AOLI_G00139330 [Acnodon oligacanthus]